MWLRCNVLDCSSCPKQVIHQNEMYLHSLMTHGKKQKRWSFIVVTCSIGDCPHISRQPSHYCFSCPLANSRKMETQSVLRDLRSVSSVLWWQYLNCLLIYNYTVFCVLRFLFESVCVGVCLWEENVSVCVEAHICWVSLLHLKCAVSAVFFFTFVQ